MAAFMTHPSVRIKGTENNFEPVLCVHPKCANKPPHMHCPFCVKSETYPDPVILKAHYRVKHVDKGLDFAGLRILRCCDHCDIVGTIKGEKKFKGPHWHCYKCRNGFNRRDEAIKHYGTHFRNPQTTFQIQVAQEVNIMLNNMNSTESVEAVENIGDHTDFGMHSTLSDGYYSSEEFNNHKNNTSTAQVGANETVDASDAQTIMIIQDRDAQDVYKDDIMLHGDQKSYDDLLQQKDSLERRVESLEDNLKLAELTHAENEKLKVENATLAKKVAELTEELNVLKDMSDTNHSGRLNQLIDSLVDEVQSNTKRLLMEQLYKVKAESRDILLSDKQSQKTQLTDASIQTATETKDTQISDSFEPKPKRTRQTRLS